MALDRAAILEFEAHVEVHAEVGACIQRAMSAWTFSVPDKKARFELVLKLVIG